MYRVVLVYKSDHPLYVSDERSPLKEDARVRVLDVHEFACDEGILQLDMDAEGKDGVGIPVDSLIDFRITEIDSESGE